MRARAARFTALVGLAALACNEPAGEVVGPEQGVPVVLELVGVPVLDTAGNGPFQAWFVDREGRLFPADRFGASAEGSLTVRSPMDAPDRIMVTWEPPADTEAGPSELKLLGGRFVEGVAELTVTGYLTPNIPLEEHPGVHVLRTFASIGTPLLSQQQDAGLWLMDPTRDTLSGHYQTFTPLTAGWMYEGWVVRDFGTTAAVWLSYGKFQPNGFRQAASRDETGLGPFSGKTDWERALPNDVRVPGDDWLANPMGVPVPGGLTLPLDLNGGDGEPSRWTHVITVEPYGERDEDPWTSVPTFLRPYRNAIGEAPPSSLRTIEFIADGVPRGIARITR